MEKPVESYMYDKGCAISGVVSFISANSDNKLQHRLYKDDPFTGQIKDKALTTKREKKKMEMKEMKKNKKVKEMKKKTKSAHEYVSNTKGNDQGSVCREQKNGLSKEGISSKWQRCLKSLIKIRKPNVKMMNNAQKLLENKSKSVDKLLLRKRERFKELAPLHLLS
ncbi:unnamed protein product [Mytilus edulis]|uniref:Uncharacterized protein n=1 Tax=Mytilus edulis TaxID=6550 RepID=A0A8S3V3Q4_MYTED|nr:unnamed protein product [Mytilus edulis]